MRAKGIQLAALIALIGVLFVFLAPSIDLPDTIKVTQVAILAVTHITPLFSTDVINWSSQIEIEGPQPASDLLTKFHALRI
ncbi:MAG: hypothetical protein CXZ00_10670 [Acidobacteria bacterium]|nr:MAG: hypothetical protein CXZ00_10670 [Acidobacteriota bacterium]